LQKEADQLRSELGKLDVYSAALPAADQEPEPLPAPEAAGTEPAAQAVTPAPPASLRHTVATVMTKPSTWFAVTGWALALLLLFRRRSI
jgi:hypothetical protein